MKNISLASASILMLIGTLLFAAVNSTPAHGATSGTVCIIPNGASTCPLSPATITGISGTQVRVSVFIQGSGGLDGFDITLLGNHTIIKPAGIDLTGTVLLGTPVIVIECLRGVLLQGGAVCSSRDTVDTIHLAATSAIGSPLTSAPTAGLLFTAIYNVTGTTAGSPLGFQTGCTNTSVSPNICVTAANGSPTPDPETVQTAIFSTTTTPDFALSASLSSITINAGSSATSTLSVTSVNNFSGTVGLNTTVVTGNLVVTVNPSSVTLLAGQTATSTVTVSVPTSTPTGTYVASIAGISGSLFHTVGISVTVNTSAQPDFTITANPTSLTVAVGTSGTSTISLHGLNGFNNTVLLTVSASTGLTATINPASTGPFGTATLTVSSTTAGTYSAQVTGTSGSLSHATTVTVAVSTSGVGVVCIIPSGATSCPSSPATITGTSGTQVRVSVFIQGSGGLLGFDVTLVADHTILEPVAIDPTGSVLIGTPVIVLECRSGVLVTGATCSPTDSVNTFHLAATSALGSPLTSTPTTGLLFTAIYNVTGSTSGIPLAFQTGCANTSASPNICVTVANGSPTPVPETVLAAILTTGTAPDFALSTNPTSLNIPQGSSATSSLTLTSLNGFTGTVTLTDSSSPTGLTVTLSTMSVGLSSGGTGSSVLTVSATSSTPLGTYVVTVTGSSGSISHSTSITVTITGTTSGDFTISENPTFQAIPVGSERQTVITVTSVNGFSGNVNLVIRPSSSAFACWFTTLTNTSTVFVPAGGFANQYPTCGAGRPAGAYNATISGTSGSLSHFVVLGVTVTDYSLSASSVSFAAGSSGSSAVTLTSLFGLSGPVGLSVATPSAVTGTCPSSVTLSSGGTSTASCTFSSTVPGTYGATITGTFVCSDCYYNGKDIQATNITVTVSGTGAPDFSISASPSSLTLTPGSSGTSTITITSINGFSGTISLTLTHSNGIGAIINPTSITGSGTATLTIGANATGTFSVQVTGTSGTLSHSLSVSVTAASIGVVCVVPSGTTSCPISPSSLTGAVGTQLRVSVFIQGSGGLLGFDVTLLSDHTILKPVRIDLTGTVLTGTPVIVLECVSGVLVSGSTCSPTDSVNTFHLAATSALGSPLTNAPTTGLLFTAIYNVTGSTSGIPLAFQTGCSNTSVPGGVCVTIANGAPTPVPETIQTATFSNSTPVPDFTITASPSSLTVARGSCDASSTITLTSVNGFSGTITLTTVTPVGITATFSSATATLSPGGSVTIALTVCTAALTPSGSYTIVVTATSGSITHMATMTLIVPSQAFSVSAIPNALTIRRGSTNSSIGVSTLTIVSSGFTGTVNISASITPTAPHSPTIKLSSTSVTLSSGGTGQVFLTVAAGKNTPTGSYSVTVTFTSGSVTQTVVVGVTVVR